MYMTVLRADARSLLRAVKPLPVDDAYQIHQWLTRQQGMHRVDDDLLYHIEQEPHCITLYIQSKTMFNLRGVEDRGFIVVSANVPVNLSDTVGEKLCFQVRVLPHKYLGSRRVPITDASERDAWFVQKCAQAGLDVLACQACETSPIVFTKEKTTVRQVACTYAGVAVVRDVEAVRNMLCHGFGRGKAFGAGLFMTV